MEQTKEHQISLPAHPILNIIGDKVALGPWEYNHAAQRAYAKAGFREIGRRRQAKFMGGKLWDIVYMDCLATEFVSPVLNQVLMPDEQRFQAEQKTGEKKHS